MNYNKNGNIHLEVFFFFLGAIPRNAQGVRFISLITWQMTLQQDKYETLLYFAS